MPWPTAAGPEVALAAGVVLAELVRRRGTAAEPAAVPERDGNRDATLAGSPLRAGRADRAAVGRDDERSVGGGAEELVGVSMTLMRWSVAVEVAGGLVDVDLADGGAQRFQAEAVAGEQVGLASMRTAGLALPPMFTWPTPLTCAIFCARIESAASYSCGTVMVSEVSARIRMGASAGLILR